MQRCELCPGLLNLGMLLRQPPTTPRIQTVAVLWRWERGGEGDPPHTHLFFLLWFLRVAPEAETISKDCGCPTPSGPRESFPPEQCRVHTVPPEGALPLEVLSGNIFTVLGCPSGRK